MAPPAPEPENFDESDDSVACTKCLPIEAKVLLKKMAMGVGSVAKYLEMEEEEVQLKPDSTTESNRHPSFEEEDEEEEEEDLSILFPRLRPLPPGSVIGILDMDAFEVQIYLKKLMGVETGRHIYLTMPCILADPTTDRIISVNFLAKAKNISREDRVGSAKEKCPEVHIIRKLERFGKPENFNLRHSSWSVLDAILKYRKEREMSMIVDYASNDEYYMDLTEDVKCRLSSKVDLENLKTAVFGENTFLEAKDEVVHAQEITERLHTLLNQEEYELKEEMELKILTGCIILEEIRNFVYAETNFEASGGISCNKVLAKLACPLHKPGGMTILPREGLFRISVNIPIEKLPSLGGERGKAMRDKLNGGEPMTIQQLATVPFKNLRDVKMSLGQLMGIRHLAQGASDVCVIEKLVKESAMVSKANLRGLYFSKTMRIRHVLRNLLGELLERLGEEEERHGRIPAKNIDVNMFYIFLPKEEEDRGKAPELQMLEYPYDKEKMLKCDEWVTRIMDDFLATVGNKDGVITKLSFAVRRFVKVTV